MVSKKKQKKNNPGHFKAINMITLTWHANKQILFLLDQDNIAITFENCIDLNILMGFIVMSW